jgi:formylglycine-generating enzyme required for sulfatase activity
MVSGGAGIVARCIGVLQKEQKTDKQQRKFRLPTEAEWEYACRAGTKKAYFFGSDPAELPKYAAFDGLFLSGHTEPVGGGRKPNAFGLYDMYGNIDQWCADYYGPYESLASENPLRTEVGPWDARTTRGGCWFSKSNECGSARRGNFPANTRSNFVGFRVCVPLD